MTPFPMWRIAPAALIVLAIVAAATPGMADSVTDCRQNADLRRKADGCTALLGVLDGTIGDNAWALAERANAACWAGYSERAVVDIWRWFDEDPASIRRMQAKLARLGHFTGEIDGGFSAALDEAVIAWADAGCPQAR